MGEYGSLGLRFLFAFYVIGFGFSESAEAEGACRSSICTAVGVLDSFDLVRNVNNFKNALEDLRDAPSRNDPTALTAAGTRARAQAHFGFVNAALDLIPFNEYTVGALMVKPLTEGSASNSQTEYAVQANAQSNVIRSASYGTNEELRDSLRDLDRARSVDGQGPEIAHKGMMTDISKPQYSRFDRIMEPVAVWITDTISSSVDTIRDALRPIGDSSPCGSRAGF